MVKEIKIISVTRDELKMAIVRHLMRNDEKDRHFFVDEIVVKENGGLSADVTISRPSGRQEQKHLDNSVLAAALLRFFMDSNIPLPRKANKNLQIVNGLVSMFLSMDNKDVR